MISPNDVGITCLEGSHKIIVWILYTSTRNEILEIETEELTDQNERY